MRNIFDRLNNEVTISLNTTGSNIPWNNYTRTFYFVELQVRVSNNS